MANKIRDYTKLAADICAAVGKDNILSATHCATRLRLVLRETPSDEVTKQISEMPAVIKVMESGGQYQVVIGTHAKDVYEALAQLLDLDNSRASAAASSPPCPPCSHPLCTFWPQPVWCKAH